MTILHILLIFMFPTLACAETHNSGTLISPRATGDANQTEFPWKKLYDLGGTNGSPHQPKVQWAINPAKDTQLYEVQAKLKAGSGVSLEEFRMVKASLAGAMGLQADGLRMGFSPRNGAETKNMNVYFPPYPAQGNPRWMVLSSADNKSVYFVGATGHVNTVEMPGGVKIHGFIGQRKEPLVVGKGENGDLKATVGSTPWNAELVEGPPARYRLTDTKGTKRVLEIKIPSDPMAVDDYEVSFLNTKGNWVTDRWTSLFPLKEE